jgi:hypothetical protein
VLPASWPSGSARGTAGRPGRPEAARVDCPFIVQTQNGPAETPVAASPPRLVELERALAYPKLRARIHDSDTAAPSSGCGRSATIVPDPDEPTPPPLPERRRRLPARARRARLRCPGVRRPAPSRVRRQAADLRARCPFSASRPVEGAQHDCGGSSGPGGEHPCA